MFRMEVRSQVSDDDDDDGSGHWINESVYQPAIFEGRVGRFGKVHRVSRQCDSDRFASKKNRVLTTHDESLKSWRHSDCCAPCLEGVTQDVATHQAIFLDARVLRQLVRSSCNNADAEESTSTSSGDSGRSNSSFRSDLASASEASVAEVHALQQRASKASEEPVLALHQRAEIDLCVAREAMLEAERLAEDETLKSARRQQELPDLANCVELSPRRASLRKSKLQKALRMTGVPSICRFLRNPFGLLKAPKIHNTYVTRTVVDAAVRPRRTMTGWSPSGASLAQMESAPAHQVRKSEIQFAAVNSTQRDGPAWTMEYMTRNGRVQHRKGRKDDEEVGGVEGNSLMNRHLGNNAHPAYDSDSD